MKRYKQLIVEIYIRLFESEKQAIPMLSKWFDKEQIMNIIGKLKDLEPTKKHKYIVPLTRIFLDLFKKDNEIADILYDIRSKLKSENIYEKIEDIEHRRMPINLHKIKNLDDLIGVINDAYGIKTKAVGEKGWGGLQEGKDYLEIPDIHPDWKITIPLNHATSQIIGHKIEGFSNWCTSANDYNTYIDYIMYLKGILVCKVYHGTEPLPDPDYRKQAIYYYDNEVIDKVPGYGRGTYERFTHSNEPFDKGEDYANWFGKEITKYIFKNWDKLRKKLESDSSNKKLYPKWLERKEKGEKGVGTVDLGGRI